MTYKKITYRVEFGGVRERTITSEISGERGSASFSIKTAEGKAGSCDFTIYYDEDMLLTLSFFRNVRVYLGYDGNNQLVFGGDILSYRINYLTRVVRIQCAGYLRRLSRTAFTKIFASTNLEFVARNIMTSTDFGFNAKFEEPFTSFIIEGEDIAIDELEYVNFKHLDAYKRLAKAYDYAFGVEVNKKFYFTPEHNVRQDQIPTYSIKRDGSGDFITGEQEMTVGEMGNDIIVVGDEVEYEYEDELSKDRFQTYTKIVNSKESVTEQQCKEFGESYAEQYNEPRSLFDGKIEGDATLQVGMEVKIKIWEFEPVQMKVIGVNHKVGESYFHTLLKLAYGSQVTEDLGTVIKSLQETAEAGRSQASRAYVYVRKGKSQTITTGTWTAISFDSTGVVDVEESDNQNFHDLAINPTRFTVPIGEGGLYSFIANIAWADDTTGRRIARFRKNGLETAGNATIGRTEETVNSAGQIYSTVVGMEELVAGDYIELLVYHTKGTDLDVQSRAIHPELETYVKMRNTGRVKPA